jgi:hypothetical protein
MQTMLETISPDALIQVLWSFLIGHQSLGSTRSKIGLRPRPLAQNSWHSELLLNSLKPYEISYKWWESQLMGHVLFFVIASPPL